jgi:CubicO group peptidase (beta-lactamase class C family)
MSRTTLLGAAVVAVVAAASACAAKAPVPPATAPPRLEHGEAIVRGFFAAYNLDFAALRDFRRRHWSDHARARSDQDLDHAYAEQRADMGHVTVEDVRLDQQGVSALVRSELGDHFRVLVLFEAAPPHRVLKMRMRSVSTAMAGGGSPAPADGEMAERVDAFASRLARADRFSGVVLLAREGRPILAKAYGLANRETRIPNTLDTRFNLGSINKLFTAVAVTQLVEARKLAYGDLLEQHLRGYPAPAGHQIGLAHLLSHSAGVGDVFGPAFWKARDQLRTPGDYVTRYAAAPLSFTPGSRFEYSNYGYAVVGRVVEIASGQSYPDYVRQHIYLPAGMAATAESEIGPARGGFAASYTQHPPISGRVLAQPALATPYLPAVGGPFGCGYSTAPDLLRFAEALRAGKLVSPASLAEMRRARFTIEPADPIETYGLGVIERRQGDLRLFGHGGGGWGVNTVFWMSDRGHTVIVLANDDPPAAERVANLAAGWLARADAAPTPPAAR